MGSFLNEMCGTKRNPKVGSKKKSEGKQKDVGRAMVMTTEMKKADISNKSLAGYIQYRPQQTVQVVTRESFCLEVVLDKAAK